MILACGFDPFKILEWVATGFGVAIMVLFLWVAIAATISTTKDK